METTTLRDYFSLGFKSFNHKKADLFCMKLSKSCLKNFDYPRETRVVLYRFSMLTISYLALECGKNDFNFESFFKLLHAEIMDRNFKTEKYTTFDCVVEDSLPHNPTVYLLYEYYQGYNNYMPDNAFEFYSSACESVSRIYNIEYDKEKIIKLWDELNGREKLREER